MVVQHIQYLPYGEPYIDQRHAGATYSERFRFTGNDPRKEMRGMPAEFVSATPLNETNIMNIPGLMETRAPRTGIWHVGERPQWK